MLFTDGEELEQAILDAPIGICVLNADNFIATIVNHKFVEIAGRPYEAIQNQFYWDAFAEVRNQYEQSLQQVVTTGQAFTANEVELILHRHGHQENVFVTFVYSPIKDTTGTVTKVAVWVLENTRQVLAREEEAVAKNNFREEVERLKTYFMQAPAGITILRGPDLVYELVNPAYQQLLPGRELLNKPILEALPELAGTPIDDILKKVYQTGETFQIDELAVPIATNKDGPLQERYFTFSYQAWRNENNAIDGILVIAFEVTRMVSTMNALQLSREQAEQQKRVYETITSGTPDLMYVFDLDYRFSYVNSALLSMWGKRWEDAIGKGLRENGYEEWHAQMHEREIDQIKATKQSIRGEVSFPHAVLGTRIYDYILIPVLNENGEVEAVAGTTRDISDRKKLEEKLEKITEELQAINEEMYATNEELAASNEELMASNEELALSNQQIREARQIIEKGEVALRLAISAANFGTWFIHSVTREFITDARLKELFGYYPEEPLSIAQAITQITEEYRQYVSDQLENAIYNNGDYDVTYPVIGLHDNKLRWLRAIGNLTADPSGEFSAFTGVVMEVTEAYLAAKKIADAEENLRMAIESGELSTWHLNENSGEIIVSARFRTLFNFLPEETISYKAIVKRILPEYQELVNKAVKASFTEGLALKVEFPIDAYQDGKTRWVRSVGKFLPNAKNGNHISGVMADITEQKMDDIRKNDFIGMVSHELKTPLTSLTASIQIVQSKVKKHNDTILLNVLDKASQQTKKMATMINGFLNVSRLEASKLVLDKQNLNLNELIEDIIQETILSSNTHIIKFKPECQVTLNADPEKIGSVIHNLISNAIKYSPNTKIIQVICGILGDHAKVSIKDEGLGMTPNDTQKVFERYYRVENKQTQNISGFGIGLYLSAEIVRQHGGEIWAESELGSGSTFHFSLPIA